MKVSRIAMYVEDLDRSADFFEKYFGGVRGESCTDPITGSRSAVLLFSGDFGIELINLPKDLRHKTVLTYGYAHIAFSLGSRGDVDRLASRLLSDGYSLDAYPPRMTNSGRYESGVLDLDGNLIEISD